MREKTQKYHKYLGAIHIHTIHSDGTGDIKSIVKAAKKAGLSWIIITDHNNFDVEEGIINGIYVIKGEEISPETCNHYIAIGTDKLILPSEDIQNTVNTVREKGGFGFAAHPDEGENRKNSNRPLNWTDKNIIPDGIEIWNWFSSWADNYDDKNIFTVVHSYIFKNKLVKKPCNNTLKWWDELNNKNEEIVPAIGGVDAHALHITKYIIPVKIFPYEFMLGTINNQIILKEKLSDDFKIAKNQIINAIKNGNNVVVNRQISKTLPEIYAENSCNSVQAGEKILLDKNTYLTIHCSKNMSVVVYKDGEIFSHEKRVKITQKGKYRAEILINNKGFAYSNPIIVSEGNGLE